jgi:tetratricopeptide (TPR) repeat protein
MAILPPEILARETGLEWAPPAANALASRALSGAPSLVAFAVQDRNEALHRDATRIVHPYAVREGTEWIIRGTVEDVATQRAVRLLEATAPDPADFGRSIALAIWPGAPKKTWNPAAVRGFGTALRLPPADAVPLLEEAVRLESGFEDAWLALARMKLAASGREAATAVLSQAPDTPSVRLFLSSLRGGGREQLTALEALAKANSSDWEAWAQFASAAVQQRRAAEGAAAFSKALELNPRSPSLLNQAAYAFQLAGMHGRAIEAADAYAKLDPRGANPLDTRGEILSLAGKFQEAAKAFADAHAKDPRFINGVLLLKAAEAKRMGRDSAGAETHFEEWERANVKHPLAWLYRAVWDYGNGKTADAESRLRSNGSTVACVQLCIWKLDQGDRKDADLLLNRAIVSAGAVAANHDAVALGRAVFKGETDRALLRGVALLLRRDFAGAVSPLEQALASERPDQPGVTPVLLAWAYIETNQTPKAKVLLESWPIPRWGGDPFFEFLVFPRIFELRKRAGLGPSG